MLYFYPVHPFFQHLLSVFADLLTDSESAEAQSRGIHAVCVSYSSLSPVSSDLAFAGLRQKRRDRLMERKRKSEGRKEREN